MTDDEIDAAIKRVWPYYRPLRGIIYEREIFRAGMRAAAKICESRFHSMEGVGDEIAKKECAAHIRKAAE